jgi:tetratricopeptide (TPR) repeat protein
MMILPLRLLVMSLALTAVGLAAGVSEAASCPTSVPAEASERRALARDWFREGETADRLKDDLTAIRAYRCSMKMVPHAFTAYNLALVAERAGDLDLALDSYRQYLALRPLADDRAQLEQRMQLLEQRIAAARDGQPAASAGAQPAPTAEPERSAALLPGEPSSERPASLPVPSEDSARGPGLGKGGWIVAGVGAASLVAGVAFNMIARSRMSECRSLADGDDVSAARQVCQSAKPYAYGSYALIAGAGVAAVVDLALLWKHRTDERLAVIPLSGGAAVALSGRF